MQLIPIREVSQSFNVSTRTLRYYEEVGLIHSVREGDGAIRSYDEEALRSLKQILVLRALRLPLKQIRAILQGGALDKSLAMLERHAMAIDQEAAALDTIRAALLTLIEAIRETGELTLPEELLDDEAARDVVRTLAIPIPTIKEDSPMPQLTDVRIVYLPPATVCSASGKGPEAEQIAGDRLLDFIRENDLIHVKPDLRTYGFNSPDGQKPDGSDHGYTCWVTIPDDMEVKAPCEKKHFPGGLYAAHMIPFGAFEEWQWLVEWAVNNKDYQPRWGTADNMAGMLEEHLNFVNHVPHGRPGDKFPLQLDLLVPIEPKE